MRKTILTRLGSPPHTWRKHENTDSDYRLDRITSTYVEKTSWLDPAIPSIQDHLHIRGENLDELNEARKSLGSPPHTWRKLHLLTV